MASCAEKKKSKIIISFAQTNFNNAKANPANTSQHIYDANGKEIINVVLPKPEGSRSRPHSRDANQTLKPKSRRSVRRRR